MAAPHKRIRFDDAETPWRAYDQWPANDDSLESVDICDEIAHLPHSDPRREIEDGLIVFMTEAFRCLQPGGLLTIRAPLASHSYGIAHPLNVRFFNEGSFAYFGYPVDGDPSQQNGPGWAGFHILSCSQTDAYLIVQMEKPKP